MVVKGNKWWDKKLILTRDDYVAIDRMPGGVNSPQNVYQYGVAKGIQIERRRAQQEEASSDLEHTLEKHGLDCCGEVGKF